MEAAVEDVVFVAMRHSKKESAVGAVAFVIDKAFQEGSGR